MTAAHDTAKPKAGKLKHAPRNRGLRDLVTFHKTRKLFLIWTPFLLVVFRLGVWLAPSPWVVPAGLLFGVGVYSFIEYLMHRFLYHWEPENRLLRLITGDVGRHHMKHHREPHKYGGAINGNQAPVVGLATVLALTAWLTPFPDAFGLIAVAAGAANYVAQEFVHFGTHHLPMKSRLLTMAKRHHMLHHYRDENSNFGLFWPFWDHILGTSFEARQRKAAPRG